MKIVLGIEMLTPSLNRLLSMHWSQRRKLKQRMSVALLFAIACSRLYETATAKGKRKLTIARFAKRMCDQDNLVGGFKPLIDAIKDHGLIVDDNPKLVELVPLQFKCAVNERERMEITLEDI